MVFEAFLGDPRSRPLSLRLLGYFVSALVHVPPMGAFIVGSHSRAFLIDRQDETRPPNFYAITFFRVPADVVGSLPGGGAPGAGLEAAAGPAGDGGPTSHAIHAFRQKRRRPLVLPHNLRKGAGAQENSEIGTEDALDDPDDASGNAGGGANRNGQASAIGNGTGGGATGGSGRAVAAGSGVGTAGYGIAAGSGGLPSQPPAPSPLSKPGTPQTSTMVSLKPGGGDSTFTNRTGDEETDPLPGRPTRISMERAAYLRTYEPFPTLPESCWPPGRTSNDVLLEICVTEAGEVGDVIPRRSTAPEYDTFLSTTIRTWRYRPNVVEGSAQPFCHLLRIVYTRVSPFSMMHW